VEDQKSKIKEQNRLAFSFELGFDFCILSFAL